MKIVTVGYFDNIEDYNILNQIKNNVDLNCERLIIYLYTDRLNNTLQNDYLKRKSNLHNYLVDLDIKSYINLLDTKSLYFLCQYDLAHYKIVLPYKDYKFEIPPSNLVYSGDLKVVLTGF